MTESKPIYSTRPVVRLDPDGGIWLWLHGSRLRRLKPEEVQNDVLADGEARLFDEQAAPTNGTGEHIANEAIPVGEWAATVTRLAEENSGLLRQLAESDHWDAVEVLKRVKRIE